MSGKLVVNVMHFARLLRALGIPVGPERSLAALRALATIDITRRDDFYWTLHAVWVQHEEHRVLFELAFRRFWHDPDRSGISPTLAALWSRSLLSAPDPPQPGARRLAEVWQRQASPAALERSPPELVGRMSWSQQEVLRTKDFEQMSADEIAMAKTMIARLRPPWPEMVTRRTRAVARGRHADLRAAIRASLREGGDRIPLRWRAPRRRAPALVVLCDISGSMSTYSRMLLHFAHALTRDGDRVHTFLFATRLTNISRALQRSDVDVALSRLGTEVQDWDGGTRIAACLKEFNYRWSRRVLGQGAVVLLISDGLDRDDGGGLDHEMARLRRSCRRLLWLNPLLRYEAFEPRAAGVCAMLPHVDEMRPAHNISSLADLGMARSRRPRNAVSRRQTA